MIFHSGENLQFLVKVLYTYHTSEHNSIPEGLSTEQAQQFRQAQTDGFITILHFSRK